MAIKIKLFDKVARNQGLVLYLPGIEGTGSLIHDVSQYHNNGAITGATWTQLPSGIWVLSFDGVDDYVDCGNDESLQITGALTLASWVKPTLLGSAEKIIRKDGSGGDRGFYYQVQADGKVIFLISSDGTALSYWDTTDALTNGVWQYVVAVFNPGSIMDIYVNGVFWERYPGTIPSAIYNTSGNLTISFSADAFDGLIGEVRIYNRALSASEVESAFNQDRDLFGV